MEQETRQDRPTAETGAFWARVREHKVIQWTVAYLGASLALAHGAELVTHAFQWPDTVWRMFVVVLVVGFPIALTVAWYHGHKGLTSISAGELSIVAVLVLIGAVIFTAALRPQAGQVTESGAHGIVDSAAAVSAGGDATAGTEPRAQAGTEPTTQPRAALTNTVAVLPFANNSSDAEQDHFAVGLSDQLRDSLSRLQGLTVTGRTSSFHFKDTTEDLRAIGEQLGVEYVVEGSVQRAGDQLRITAELNNTRTGYRQWGETYPGSLSDIFAIQDEITKSVAEALQITLGVGDWGRIPGMTRNVAAYEEFLTANGFIADFRAESLRSAIEHLERAVSLDPAFAMAWFVLGNTYLDGALVVSEESAQWTHKGRQALERGRELTPDSPFAVASAAYASAERGSWREAGVFYEEQLPALTRGSTYNTVALWQGGVFLTRVGRVSDAIRYLERARAADPLFGEIALRLGDAYASAGAFPSALAELDRAEQLGQSPDFVRGTAFVTALASRDREEIERRLAPLAPPPGNVDVNRVLARLFDDRAAGAAEVRRLAASDVAKPPLAAVTLAQWAGYYDDPETALELLRQNRRFSAVLVSQIIWRPVLADVRKLAGFKDLVRDMGFVDYWREFGWGDFCKPSGENDFACE